MGEKEASLYSAILICCVVLGTIFTYFIISILRQQRKNIELYKKNLRTEISTLEKERARVAADLHDEIGPVLASIKLRVTSFDLHDPDDVEQAKRTEDQIDVLITRMREISFDLMPNTLLRKGLPAVMDEFIQVCNRSTNLSIKFQYQPVVLNEEQSINLYRIIQEIVHNAVKHSQASEVIIELRKDKDCIILAARDNGVGFNYETTIKTASGRGLQNLYSRAEMIRGKMFVDSKKGKGVTYIFEIPA